MGRLTQLAITVCTVLALIGSTPAAQALAWPSYVLETIELQGNERSADALILQQVDLDLGSPLTDKALERVRLRILGLGLFRTVAFKLQRGSAPGKVKLLITVTERPSFVVTDLFLGFTSVSPFYVGGGIADTNFLGRNLRGSLQAVLGADGRGAVRAGLQDPSLFASKTSFASELGYYQDVEVNCPSWLGRCAEGELDRLRTRRIGGQLAFGRRAGPNVWLFLGYRGELVTASREEGSLRQGGGNWGDSALPSLPEGDSLLSSLSATFDLDTRDDPFIATRGFHLRMQAELSTPFLFSSYSSSRYQLEFSWHHRAFADHTVRLHSFLGLVQGEAPFFDRFHVADHSYFTVGANTVPRALEVSFTEVSQYDPLLMTLGADYQIPIFSGGHFVYRGFLYAALQLTVSASDSTRSVFDLTRDPRNEISRFPLSGDLGLRLDTAIGAFSLGLSYPLDLLF